jgi:hypothetical protein
MMTIKQLYKACELHPFIKVRTPYGLTAINSKVRQLAMRKLDLDEQDTRETSISGFIPCSLQEYITYKVGFISNGKPAKYY